MTRHPNLPDPAEEPSATRTMPATEAQNNFGRVLQRAAAEGAIFITKYGRPSSVVLSIERYRALVGRDRAPLEDLTREFDEMLARMQGDQAAAGIEALFDMGSEELGRAAVRGAHGDTD